MRIMAMAGILVALAGSARAQVVNQSGTSGSVRCDGAAAEVGGNGNRLFFTGACSALRINGNDNVVAVDLAPGGRVRVRGDNNRVVYPATRPAPEADMRGAFNEMVPGALPAPSAALLLDGRVTRRDVSCRNLDVVIRESAVSWRLRGGCRSVTVDGDRDVVAAELLPGARLIVGGAGVVINYALVSDGPPPDVLVTSPANRATHLMRVGEASLLLPTRNGPP